MTQVALNPALSGGFEGTARIGGLFREQDFGNGFGLGQYRSPVLYVDAPLIRGFRKQDWVGFGFAFQYDEQKFAYESDKYNANNAMISTNSFGGLSYHFSFEKKKKNVISIGLQVGMSNVSFKSNVLTTPQDIEDYLNNLDNPCININQELPFDKKEKTNKLGYSIGTVFTSNISDFKSFKLGLTASSIGNRSYYSKSTNKKLITRSFSYFVFSIYRTELLNGLIFEPRVFFRYLQPSWDGSVQLLAGVRLTNPTTLILYGGLGYNQIGEVHFLLGVELYRFEIFGGFGFNHCNGAVNPIVSRTFEIGTQMLFKSESKKVKRFQNVNYRLLRLTD